MTRIIPRSETGLPEPTGGARNTTARSNRTGFVAHWDGGETPRDRAGEIRLLLAYDRFHRQQGWGGLGYNLAVGPATGNIYNGRGIDNIGAHAGGHNTANIGVVLIGGPGNLTEAGMRGMREAYAFSNRHVGRTLAQRVHSDLNPTQCPGDVIRAWVRAGGLTGAGAPAPNPTPPAAGTATRTAVPAGVNGRAQPNTGSAVRQFLAGGTVGTFNGVTRGQSVEGNNIWFRGAFNGNWFWSGGFTNRATTGLPEINTTPAPAPAPTPAARIQRTAVPAGVNGRAQANTGSPVRQFLTGGTVGNFDAFTRGQSVEGENRWLRGAINGNWFWLGGFTSRTTGGLRQI